MGSVYHLCRAKFPRNQKPVPLPEVRPLRCSPHSGDLGGASPSGLRSHPFVCLPHALQFFLCSLLSGPASGEANLDSPFFLDRLPLTIFNPPGHLPPSRPHQPNPKLRSQWLARPAAYTSK